MTAGGSSGVPSRVPGDEASDLGRRRSLQTVVYTGVTLISGVGALVILGFVLAEGDSSVLDVLWWGALSVLLLGSAAHQWWFAGRPADRSRHIHDEITRAEVAAVARESNGEIDAVRRLRVAHPGLGLRDAYELMQAYKLERTGDSA